MPFPRVDNLLLIPVCISTVYLSETERSLTCLRNLLENLLESRISGLALKMYFPDWFKVFYKSCSKKSLGADTDSTVRKYAKVRHCLHHVILMTSQLTKSMKWFLIWKTWTCLIYETKKTFISAGNYMFKVNNRNTRTRYEICSKLTIKIPERRLLVSLLLTLNIFHTLF